MKLISICICLLYSNFTIAQLKNNQIFTKDNTFENLGSFIKSNNNLYTNVLSVSKIDSLKCKTLNESFTIDYGTKYWQINKSRFTYEKIGFGNSKNSNKILISGISLAFSGSLLVAFSALGYLFEPRGSDIYNTLPLISIVGLGLNVVGFVLIYNGVSLKLKLKNN